MVCQRRVRPAVPTFVPVVIGRHSVGGPPPAPPKEGSALRKGDKDDTLRPPPAPPKEGSALRKMGKYTTCRGFRAFSFGAGV